MTQAKQLPASASIEKTNTNTPTYYEPRWSSKESGVLYIDKGAEGHTMISYSMEGGKYHLFIMNFRSELNSLRFTKNNELKQISKLDALSVLKATREFAANL